MLELGEVPVELVPNQNISPGQGVPVILDSESRNVEIFRWGLVPSWAKDPSIGYKLFNARAETLSEKPSFRNAFSRRRCLIPASGFYEWKQENSSKQPYLFQLKERRPFTFAGIWEHWQDDKGNEILSCSIITITPNSLIADYHDRMPVILNETNRWQWFENRPAAELLSMLLPFPSEEMEIPVQVNPMLLRNIAV